MFIVDEICRHAFHKKEPDEISSGMLFTFDESIRIIQIDHSSM